MPTIRKRGSSYQAIARVKQGGVVVFEEARSFPREALARDWGRRVEAQIKQHGVPQRALATTTLGTLLTRHYEMLVKQGKPRQNEHEIAFLASRFAGKPLAALTAEHFSKFALERRAAGVGPSTILHNLATVRSVLNAAKPVHGLEVDGKPVIEAISALTRLGVVSKSNVRERRVSDEELARLDADFKRMAGHPSNKIPMDVVVKLAVALPRRREELTSMLWEDYDGSVIVLRDTKNQTAAVRNECVPVPPAAQAILDTLPRIDARILPYEPESVSAAFQRACKRLGIDDLHFHDLRHEGISRLFESGMDIPEVSLISGHRSWNMLRRYTNLKPHAVAEKMTRNARSQEAQEATA